MCIELESTLYQINTHQEELLQELWVDRIKTRIKKNSYITEAGRPHIWYDEHSHVKNVAIRVMNINRTIKRLEKSVTYMEKVTMYFKKCLKCRFWLTKTTN